MKEQSPHTKFVSNIKANIARQRDVAKKILADKDKINAVATVVDSAIAGFEAAGCNVNRWDGYTEVSFRFSVSGLPSFKDPALIDLIESLMGHGFEFTSHDCAAAINRDFSGHMTTESGIKIDVYICAYVKEGSDACRRIVKSVKYVEQFEFEIVCD